MSNFKKTTYSKSSDYNTGARKQPTKTFYANERIAWGIHKGKLVSEIIKQYPSYVVWLRENTDIRFSSKETDLTWKDTSYVTLVHWAQGTNIKPQDTSQYIDFS
mgnify:FL=1